MYERIRWQGRGTGLSLGSTCDGERGRKKQKKKEGKKKNRIIGKGGDVPGDLAVKVSTPPTHGTAHSMTATCCVGLRLHAAKSLGACNTRHVEIQSWYVVRTTSMYNAV